MSASPGSPSPDWLGIVKFHDALCGGTWADAGDRRAAAQAGDRFPGARRKDPVPGGAVGEEVIKTRVAHGRAAAWAVTEDGAKGVVFAGCGYPFAPDPHSRALARAPRARFAYVDNDKRLAVVNCGNLGGPQVSSRDAPLDDPAAVMRTRDAQAIGFPLQVQSYLCAHWWPPGLCAEIVAGYAALIGSGSTFVMSLGIPDDDAAGREFAAALSAAGRSPVWSHTEADVASWVTGAGMKIFSRGGRGRLGVAGVRGRGRPWAEALVKPRLPGRIVYVAARKPLARADEGKQRHGAGCCALLPGLEAFLLGFHGGGQHVGPQLRRAQCRGRVAQRRGGDRDRRILVAFSGQAAGDEPGEVADAGDGGADQVKCLGCPGEWLLHFLAVPPRAG